MTKTKQAMGKAARRKGHDFEREIARRFREAMPGAEICRGQQARDGVDAPDVSPPVFWVEAKHCNKINTLNALLQAEACAPKGRVPVAICKKTRGQATATIRLTELLDLTALLRPAIKHEGAIDPPLSMPMDDFFLIVKQWWAEVSK